MIEAKQLEQGKFIIQCNQWGARQDIERSFGHQNRVKISGKNIVKPGAYRMYDGSIQTCQVRKTIKCATTNGSDGIGIQHPVSSIDACLRHTISSHIIQVGQADKTDKGSTGDCCDPVG